MTQDLIIFVLSSQFNQNSSIKQEKSPVSPFSRLKSLWTVLEVSSSDVSAQTNSEGQVLKVKRQREQHCPALMQVSQFKTRKAPTFRRKMEKIGTMMSSCGGICLFTAT